MRRSAFAGALAAALALLGLAATAAWAFQAPAFGWRHLLAWGALAGTTLWAAVAWLRSPCGILSWDGQCWTWQRQGADAEAGSAAVALDLQARLLLRWTAEGRPQQWLWVERESDLSHWEALRRAVYSRPSMPASPAGPPSAAEQ